MSPGATTPRSRRLSSSACTAGRVAGDAEGREPVEHPLRGSGVHRGLSVGKGRPRAQGLAHEPRRSRERRQVHLGPDRHLESGLQHRRDEGLRGRAFQRRRHGVRPFLHPVRPDRGGGDGGVGSTAAVRLVYGLARGSDDRVSRDRRSDRSVPRWQIMGGPADRFRTSRRGRPTGLEETVQPDPSSRPLAADVTRLEYADCADDAAVVLYTVKGGGHSWPGGGPLPEWLVGAHQPSIDATSQMWAFFRDHRLVRERREPAAPASRSNSD